MKQKEELLYSVGNTWMDCTKIIPGVTAQFYNEFKKSLDKHAGNVPQ